MQRHLHSRSSDRIQKWKNVMYGSRDPKSRLWRVSLKQKCEPEIVQCNHAHDNNNQKDLINYLHAACFSPVKSTWIKAIQNGIFSSWPGLNEHTVENHLSKSTSIAKGHLNQQRQNARKTKIKNAPLLDPENDIDHGIETQFVYAATIDAGQMYTDQTDKLLLLPQPPVRARTDARTNPRAQRATQLRRVLARAYAVSIQNQITTTVP
jgi:hypothetical protein